MSADDQCFHNNVQVEHDPYRLVCEGCGVEVFTEPGGGYTDRDGEPLRSIEEQMERDIQEWDRVTGMFGEPLPTCIVKVDGVVVVDGCIG
jgi:hypothetical protein